MNGEEIFLLDRPRGQSEAVMRFPAADSINSRAFPIPTDTMNSVPTPVPVPATNPISSMQPTSMQPIITPSSQAESVPSNSTPDTAPPAVPPSSRRVRRARKQRAKAAKAAVESGDCKAYRECLEQAEICREQARAAARLKRFKAARGLFATAISLCQRALGAKTGESGLPTDTTLTGQGVAMSDTATLDAQARDAAQEYLRQLTIEMSTYSELAKSMERPLSSQSTPSIHTAAAASSATMPVASTSSSFSNPTVAAPPKPSGC